MNNLRNKVRKAIRPACEMCGGDGKTIMHKDVFKDVIETYSIDCKSCLGKGYVEELEFGCEILWEYVHTNGNQRWLKRKKGIVLRTELNYRSGDYSNVLVNFDSQNTNKKLLRKDFRNLGKPLELQEVLLALSGKYIYLHYTGYLYEPVDHYCPSLGNAVNSQKSIGIKLPLDLQPEQYPQELQDKIMELLE